MNHRKPVDCSLKALRKPSGEITSLLARNLRSLRSAQRLSQEQLAEIAGLHRTYVGSVERGERNVTLSSLELLAKALGVNVVELLSVKAANGDL
jgi:transcriptional regulator with XRE-family HTH domain